MESKSQNFTPYLGPRPFERSESGLFFGREKETRHIVNLIFANSVVVFYSKSGVGKTSLLNAGVIPQLTDEGIEVLPSVRVAGQIPQHIRSNEVRNIYVFNAISWCEGDQGDLRQLSKSTLAGYLKERTRILNDVGKPSARVIIFDQFEELFVQYPDRWEDRQDFFEQVRDALEQDHLLRLVFSLREDYLGEMEPYISLLRGKLQGRFRLERWRREDALAAVENPLLATGRTFGVGVAERIVDDLMKVRYSTPEGGHIEKPGQFIEPTQLQVVCHSLWRNLPPDVTVITLDHIQAFGVVNQELSRMYEMSIRRATQKTGVKERDLRAWFEQSLITPARTRGTVYRGTEETGGIPNTAIDVLENLHIIRAELHAGARWYELTHDTLIEPILESNKIWLTKQ